MLNKTLSFFHPVGSHAGETLQNIISRKKLDIFQYGETLWSFSFVSKERLNLWRNELNKNNQNEAFVFCCGENSKDPMKSNEEPYWLSQYSTDMLNWEEIKSPKSVSYHRPPRKGGIVAGAFIISDIITNNLTKIKRPDYYFNSAKNAWINEKLPTRGEYLILSPETGNIQVKCILKIKYPFIVYVK